MKTEYAEDGYVSDSVNAMILLIVGIVIVTVMLIFGGVLSGQVFVQTDADITAITNTTVENSVRNSIGSGFEAFNTAGSYIPIIVLAIIIFLVLGLVMSLGGGAMSQARGGSYSGGVL